MLECPVCRARHPEGTHVCPEDGSALLPTEAFAAVDKPIEPGTMVGEYRVERKLGEGSFGAVYAGVQPLIGKRVAIKLLHKKMSSEPEVVARFIGEARAVNRIGHRNIIDVFSFGVHEGSQHYFVMELCDGLTLGELLQREGRLSIDAALPILRGIADGLDAAHAAGVTHRDLKPDNVFLVLEKDGSYFPKLLDFGVAKLGGDEAGHQKTATGIAIGTPRYMAPEQSRGKKVDHRADIYALGVVAHEMLTGKPLFEADSMVDLLFKHATDAPPGLSSVNPDLPEALDAPVLAMVAKRASARPSSAGAAIAALEAVAREIPKQPSAPASIPEAAAEGDASIEEKLEPRVGTGTVAIAVSASGTLLGEPIVATNLPEAAAATAIPSPPPADVVPRGRSGIYALLVAAAIVISLLTAFVVGRGRVNPDEAPVTKPQESVAPAALPSENIAVLPATSIATLPAENPVEKEPTTAAPSANMKIPPATTAKTTQKRRLNKDLERPKEIK